MSGCCLNTTGLFNPKNNANIKHIRKNADRYLREIELAGVAEFNSWQTRYYVPQVAAIWKDLKIEYGQRVEWKNPGIGIGGPVSGGRSSHDEVWKAAETEMLKADNLAKLRLSGREERHLFVYIGHYQGPAYVSIRHCEPPEAPPELPKEVTHLWVATAGSQGAYVWLATTDKWTNLSIVTLQPEPI